MFQGCTFFDRLRPPRTLTLGGQVLYNVGNLEKWIPWISLYLTGSMTLTDGFNGQETPLQFNPKLTQIAWIALGLHLNVTKVSSSLGSLYRSNFIFGYKEANGPNKQPK